MSSAYTEYIKREKVLIYEEITNNGFNLFGNDDVVYRLMVAEVVQNLQSKDFLVYYLRNCIKLDIEQEKRWRQRNLANYK